MLRRVGGGRAPRAGGRWHGRPKSHSSGPVLAAIIAAVLGLQTFAYPATGASQDTELPAPPSVADLATRVAALETQVASSVAPPTAVADPAGGGAYAEGRRRSKRPSRRLLVGGAGRLRQRVGFSRPGQAG